MSTLPQGAEEGALLDLLSQELTNIARTKQDSAQAAITMMEDSQTPQRIANSLDSTLIEVAQSPTEYEIGRIPTGSQIIHTFGTPKLVEDTRRKETIVMGTRPEFQEPPAAAQTMDAYETTRRMQERAEKPRTTLNVTDEIAKLNTLKGDERAQAASTLMVNIRRLIAEESALIQQEAARRSGLAEAEANFRMNQKMDFDKGGVFATRASAQTKQAEALLNSAVSRSEHYLRAAATSSTRLQELTGYLKDVETFQQRIAMREMQTEQTSAQYGLAERDRRERQEIDFQNRLTIMQERSKLGAEVMLKRREWDEFKLRFNKEAQDERQARTMEERELIRARNAALLASTVDDQQLLNYRLAYGKNEGDYQDRLNIVNRRDKDKELQQVLLADTSTIHEMLTSPERSIREFALKIVKGRDIIQAERIAVLDEAAQKRINSAPDSPLVQSVRAVIGNASTLNSLVDFAKKNRLYEPDIMEARASAALQAAGAKEREQLRGDMLVEILNTVVQRQMENSVAGDVRLWKTTEMTGILKPVLDAMRPPGKDGKVRLSDFADAVADTDIIDPITNQKLTRVQKIDLLRQTIGAAVENSGKSMLFPGSDALIHKLASHATNRITHRFVNKILELPGQLAAEGVVRHLAPYQSILRQVGLGGDE